MRLEVYSVHDAAVGAFLPPFFARSRGEAIRQFEDAARDTNRFGTHGKDFSLYFIGEWSDENGLFKAVDVPDRIAGALDFARPSDT